jgi:hypothetical protein
MHWNVVLWPAVRGDTACFATSADILNVGTSLGRVYSGRLWRTHSGSYVSDGRRRRER